MRLKRKKQARKQLSFFRTVYHLLPPYRVLLDGQFVQDALLAKIYLKEALPELLQDKAYPVITSCVHKWLRDRGEEYAGAALATRRMDRMKCGHEPAKDPLHCLVSVVEAKAPYYVVGAQDQQIRKMLRSIPGVPLSFISNSMLMLEKLSDQRKDIQAEQISKLRINKLMGIEPKNKHKHENKEEEETDKGHIKFQHSDDDEQEENEKETQTQNKQTQPQQKEPHQMTVLEKKARQIEKRAIENETALVKVGLLENERKLLLKLKGEENAKEKKRNEKIINELALEKLREQQKLQQAQQKDTEMKEGEENEETDTNTITQTQTITPPQTQLPKKKKIHGVNPLAIKKKRKPIDPTAKPKEEKKKRARRKSKNGNENSTTTTNNENNDD